MPTKRTFQLDIDSKKYINRVNTFRKLNGVSNLLPPDIADIDNFVVGLKDLGVWQNSIPWLLTSPHNVGTGSVVVNLKTPSYDGKTINSPIWTTLGISTSAASSQIVSLPVPPIQTLTFQWGWKQISFNSSYEVYTRITPRSGSYIGDTNRGGSTSHAIYVSTGNPAGTYGYISYTGEGSWKTDGMILNNGVGTTAYAVKNGVQSTINYIDVTLTPKIINFLVPFVEATVGGGYFNPTTYGAFSNTLASYYLILNNTISLATFNSISTLYKTTVGKAVPLP